MKRTKTQHLQDRITSNFVNSHMTEDMQLSIEKIHDKRLGTDNVDLIIKSFSESIALTLPKFHWILISDG